MPGLEHSARQEPFNSKLLSTDTSWGDAGCWSWRVSVTHSPPPQKPSWPRAIFTIFSLTSAASPCQEATSSRRAKSVQAMCRQAEGASTQVLSCAPACRFRDAGAIPAASEAVSHPRLARTPRGKRRIGNKMGTGLAILAQCDDNMHRSRRYRNRLAIKAFKYHRNVFPIPRIWQKYRTQNPVLGWQARAGETGENR